MVTPHLAGATIDNFKSVIDAAVRNAIQYLGEGKLPSADVVFLPQPQETKTNAG